MSSVLESHGGTVEKFIGDAVMAVFGIPQVHEGDALRAVRAVTAMRRRLAGLNEELERDWGYRSLSGPASTQARSQPGMQRRDSHL
jgi:class 3 adenylate cyclase